MNKGPETLGGEVNTTEKRKKVFIFDGLNYNPNLLGFRFHFTELRDEFREELTEEALQEFETEVRELIDRTNFTPEEKDIVNRNFASILEMERNKIPEKTNFFKKIVDSISKIIKN